MKISSLFAAAGVALLLAGSGAYAHSKAATHTAAAATTTTAKTTTAKKASKPRSAASLECSKEADAKGLHGKARKKFRSSCMKKAKAK